MNADELTREQARLLFDAIQPMLLYLVRLEKRIVRRKFPPDDKLRVLVSRARAAIYDLRQELHQRSASGMMRKLPPQQSPGRSRDE